MDGSCHHWYYSNMPIDTSIPTFTLYGETDYFPDVVHSERFSARAPIHGWHIAAHRHANMSQLFLIDDGQMDARVDGIEMTLTEMSFLFIPANTVHEFTFQPDTSGQVISLPLNVLHSIGPASQDVFAALANPVFGPISTTLHTLANALGETTTGKTKFRAQRAVGLAHSVLSLVAEARIDAAPSMRSSNAEYMHEFDRLMKKNMTGSWTASDYAGALAISTGHLSRLCRAATGMGTTAYIEQSTMEEACRMLAFTQLSISEIGYRLGFADPSYFSKRFRLVRDQTPSDYRTQFIS